MKVCLKVELSETSNLNEISVIHDWEKSDNPLIGHSLSVSSDNANWTALIASESNTQENIIEKTSGTRYTNCNLNTRWCILYLFSLSPIQSSINCQKR